MSELAPSRHQRRLTVVVVLLALTATACGSQLSHSAILAAAQGGKADGVGALAPSGTTRTGTSSTGGATTGLTSQAGSGSTSTAAAGTAPTAGSNGATSSTSGTTTGGPGASTGSGGATSPDSGKRSTILLGNVGGYSGPVGASTASAQTMLKVWEAYTNDHGGLNGHPVKIISADDQSDPSKSQSLVQDMVENKHVVAFVGNMMALTAAAPRSYIEQKQVPFVGGDLTSVWSQSPMYFAQGSTLKTVVLGLAHTAVQAGKKRLGVLYCAEAGACKEIDDMLFAQGGAAAQGIQPAYHAQISLAQPDFTSECISARNASVDALSVVADVGTTNRVAASCARQGYHPTFVNTGNTVDDKQATNANLDGMLTTQNWFGWALDTGAGKTYADALKRYAPDLGSGATTAAIWASGQLLARALRDVGPGPVTSQVILQGLWTLKNETLGGLSMPLSFAEGKPTQAATCYFAQQVVRQRWTMLNAGKPECLR